MNHSYLLFKRGDARGIAMPMPEEAIVTLLFHEEIVHHHSSHVGKDKHMSHYFEYLEGDD